MSILRQILHTTARIETMDSRGKLSTATSFFFAFPLNDREVGLLLVTNRHVLKDQAVARVAVSASRSDRRSIRNVLSVDLPSKVIFHPDEDVDLAAIPWGDCHNQLSESGCTPGWQNVSPQLILTGEQARTLSPFESLVLIGYPNGIWDSVHNLPILRSANTATPLEIDYKGKPRFLINGACYPGSSGSPIFVANAGAFSNGGALSIGNRLLFVGVLSATYTQDLRGEIVEALVPTTDTFVSVAKLPIHLGICIKAHEVLSLVEVARQRHALRSAA
jgi:hypothetical protein